MKFSTETPRRKRGASLRSVVWRGAYSHTPGFTLMEVMVVMGLITILVVTTFSGILSMKLGSSRLADYTAVMAVVEAKVEDIRVATYNPPNYPFGSSTLYITNNNSVALNQAGAMFLIPGTVVSKIEPVAGGHLVTVTGTFQTSRTPISVTLQTVVNKYSGGQN